MPGSTTLDPQSASAIREALAAASSGRLADARRIGQASLASGGDVVALNAMLGTLCLKSGDFEAAVHHLRIANSQRPDDIIIVLNLGTALVELGLFAEALKLVPEELASRDSSARLLRLRAFCAQAMEDHEAAIIAYERIVALFPADWESWNNLGNSRRCAGQFDEAVQALGRAAALVSDAAPVRLNLANALVEAGRAEEGEAELRALAKDFPDDWRSLRDLHILLRSRGREEEALEAIEGASRRSPEDLELLLAVASQRLLLLDNDGAEAAYREVVRREPTNASGNLGLAIVYELSNRVEDLSRLVGEAEARQVEGDVLNVISALNHRRAKRYREGLAVMEHVSVELESARQAQLLGQLYDGAGEYDEAWRAFSRMNAIQRADSSQPQERARAYRESIRRNLEATTDEWGKAWTDMKIEDGRRSPVFLVGFPRSGTTLLDTMLMGHPQTQVLEEEPTLRRAGELLEDYVHLPEAPRELVEAARNAYFEAAAKRGPIRPDTLIIDKNPLFTAALPLIRRIFPDARIILALRHPCDVALSCFTTNFRLNDGMSNFLGLDTTAELYNLCFRNFERIQQLQPMATHQLFYEKLVADREKELRGLFGFLNLPWADEVLDHQKTALERGRIKTASYAQVAEPLYSRSSGRWRNYGKYLKPILPVLAPWIQKFGYEV